MAALWRNVRPAQPAVGHWIEKPRGRVACSAGPTSPY